MSGCEILGAFSRCLWQYSNFKVLESRKNFPTSQKEGNSLKEAGHIRREITNERISKEHTIQSITFSKYVKK